MSEVKIILLCSTRFALPAVRELAFFKLLAAVAIAGQHNSGSVSGYLFKNSF